jgi:DNA-directed RNA polymerase subunit M/transcription elongation factor TFIIS
MNATRQYAVDKFAETLELPPDDARVVNLEKGILNYVLDKFPETESTFENPKFGESYKHKFLEIRRNLQRNSNLGERLKNKTLKTQQLLSMKPWVAVPDGVHAKMRTERIHKELRKEFLAREAQNQTGFFRCGRCKSYKTSYYQLQTRSADEPMTTFVSCLNCNNNFKF